MAKINFERIADVGEAAFVQDGYRGLNWDNFYAEDASIASEGILNVIHSGRASAFNDLGRTAVFQSPDNEDDFDFNGGYFASSEPDGLRVRVVGYDDGKKVATKLLILDTDQEFVRFGPHFDGINKVTFTPSGGTDADPNDNIPPTQTCLVDDLFIDF